MPGTRCAVYGCSNNYFAQKKSTRKYSMHRFPKEKDLASKSIRNEWILRCKRKDKLNPDTSYICSAHFTENDYERDLQNELLGRPLKRVLKKTAIPRLLLYNEKPLTVTEASTEATLSRSERLHLKHSKQEAQRIVSEPSPEPQEISYKASTEATLLRSEIFHSKNAKQEPQQIVSESSPEPQEKSYIAKYTDLLANFNDLNRNYSLLEARYIKTKASCIKMIKEKKSLSDQLRYYKTKYYKSRKSELTE
ncbi:unnamed protein product [Ceutorhynchus assimilis]|uniref:THAP-type domain-containing protein n=1 Tax=Ceutorhynchus assimilis TaxID=467358 RepID=A0A9N9MTH9_9CUCU|nr:unnamed protein product [Ceutorhynchus assimilis]